MKIQGTYRHGTPFLSSGGFEANLRITPTSFLESFNPFWTVISGTSFGLKAHPTHYCGFGGGLNRLIISPERTKTAPAIAIISPSPPTTPEGSHGCPTRRGGNRPKKGQRKRNTNTPRLAMITPRVSRYRHRNLILEPLDSPRLLASRACSACDKVKPSTPTSTFRGTCDENRSHLGHPHRVD